MASKRKVTLLELEEALKSGEVSVRYEAIFDFAHTKITMESIPALLQALTDTEPGVVRCAADSLGKLGPTALNYGNQTQVDREVVWALLTAACRIEAVTHMPQAYDACLAALVKIAPQHRPVFGLIRNFISLNNWYPLKASISALKIIGTPEALELLERAIVFWTPELDKKQKRIIGEIVEGKRSEI